jgi:hypothetical protein
MKQMSKKDTERIASHLKIVGDIISKYEDMVNVAGSVERVFNNSINQ